MRVLIPVVVAVSFLVASGKAFAAQPDCGLPAYSFATWQNAVTQVAMTVRAGKLCGLKLGNTDTNRMESTFVSRRPSHGAASVHGIYVDYRSRPNYVGADRMAYTRVYTDRTGRRFTSTIEITITVVP
jgi:hypothetical protein